MQQRIIDQADPGWKVWGSDDRELGEVSELGDGYIHMTRGLIFGKSIYVPETFVDHVDPADERVYIKIGKDQIDSMGWNQPPGTASGPEAADLRVDGEPDPGAEPDMGGELDAGADTLRFPR